MPDQEKVRLMVRLAILEKEKGKELRRVEESYRSDYVGIPMLKNGLRVTAVFFVFVCLWAAGSIEFVLEIAGAGRLGILLTGILAAYVVLLLVTWIVTFLTETDRYHRSLRLEAQYQELLARLAELETGKDFAERTDRRA